MKLFILSLFLVICIGCCPGDEEVMSQPIGTAIYAIECDVVNLPPKVVSQYTLFSYSSSTKLWSSDGPHALMGTNLNLTNPWGVWVCAEDKSRFYWREGDLNSLIPLFGDSAWIKYNDWTIISPTQMLLDFVNILPSIPAGSTFTIVWFCGPAGAIGLPPKVTGVSPV